VPPQYIVVDSEGEEDGIYDLLKEIKRVLDKKRKPRKR
jgi:preprotein translocase subunit Sss1